MCSALLQLAISDEELSMSEEERTRSMRSAALQLGVDRMVRAAAFLVELAAELAARPSLARRMARTLRELCQAQQCDLTVADENGLQLDEVSDDKTVTNQVMAWVRTDLRRVHVARVTWGIVSG